MTLGLKNWFWIPPFAPPPTPPGCPSQTCPGWTWRPGIFIHSKFGHFVTQNSWPFLNCSSGNGFIALGGSATWSALYKHIVLTTADCSIDWGKPLYSSCAVNTTDTPNLSRDRVVDWWKDQGLSLLGRDDYSTDSPTSREIWVLRTHLLPPIPLLAFSSQVPTQERCFAIKVKCQSKYQ